MLRQSLYASLELCRVGNLLECDSKLSLHIALRKTIFQTIKKGRDNPKALLILTLRGFHTSVSLHSFCSLDKARMVTTRFLGFRVVF